MHRILAIFAVVALPATAHATRVTGFATGVIAEYTETDANGALVFGLDETQLLGEAVLIEFAYDTALAPADADPTSDHADYASGDPALDWLDLSITVNGITRVLDGANRRVDLLDAPSSGLPWDIFQVSIEHFYGEPEGGGPYEVHRREFLDLSELLPVDTFTGDALPTSFYTDAITPSGNSAAFRINDFDYDPLALEVTYSRYVSFNIDIQEIGVMPVPEPRSATLVALGLAALARARRRPRFDS